MTAHPKQKCTKANRGMRRSHDALTKPRSASCPNCGAPRLPHRVCSACGYYRGKQVITIANQA